MNLDLHYEEVFPQAIEKVWHAITNSEALSKWLLANDFEAQVGKKFTLRATATEEWRGFIQCQVLEIEPPRRMVWSWVRSDTESPTKVVFELRLHEGGTCLTVSHTGEASMPIQQGYIKGWTEKLSELQRYLAQPST